MQRLHQQRIDAAAQIDCEGHSAQPIMPGLFPMPPHPMLFGRCDDFAVEFEIVRTDDLTWTYVHSRFFFRNRPFGDFLNSELLGRFASSLFDICQCNWERTVPAQWKGTPLDFLMFVDRAIYGADVGQDLFTLAEFYDVDCFGRFKISPDTESFDSVRIYGAKAADEEHILVIDSASGSAEFNCTVAAGFLESVAMQAIEAMAKQARDYFDVAGTFLHPQVATRPGPTQK